MKRLISILLLLLIAICPFAQAEGELNTSLISKAREVTSLMHEMTGMDSLMELYTADSEVLSQIHAIGEADYDEPAGAVVVVVPDSCIAELLALMQVDAPEDSGLFRIMKAKLYNTIPTVLNGRMGGTVWLAATSVMDITDTFLPEQPFDGIAYVLFQYDGEQPDAICAFDLNSEVGIVAGSYLATTALDSVDWSAGASDLLKSFVGTDFPIDISGVTITRYSAEELVHS